MDESPASPRTPWDTVRTLSTSTVRDATEGRIIGLAAEVAFFGVLALPPLALVVLGSLGYVADLLGPAAAADMRTAILDTATTVLSGSTVEDLIEPMVDGLLDKGRLDLLTIGAIIAVWSASRAVRVVIDAVTLAYDREPARTWWQRRLVAVGVTIGGIISLVALLPLLVVGPQAAASLADGLGLGGAFEAAARIAYWPVVAVTGLLVLTCMYHLVEPETPWRWELPGSILALLIWVAGSYGLRFYATQFIEGESTYRLVAAPLVVLMWVYVAAFAVLLGAELNAEVDKIYFPDHPHGTAG